MNDRDQAPQPRGRAARLDRFRRVRPLRVLGWPAFRNRAEQPYNALLYSHMQRLGVDVEEHSTARVLSGRFSILHLHWPDRRVRDRRAVRAVSRSAALIALLEAARLRGVRIIWTVHNLHAHEGRLRDWLEPAYWRALTRRLDGFITLTAAGVTLIHERFPVLRDVPGFVIPHGHLRGVYPDDIDASAARRSLDVPADARVVAFVGQIREYKNAVQLVRTFRQVAAADCYLLLAGQPRPARLVDELHAAAGSDSRIRMVPGFVPDAELQRFLRAADLVVLPYRDIFNSGSAVLALSFDRPILVPRLGGMPELANVFGNQWVRTYEGELSPALLEEAIAWATDGQRPRRPDMAALGWDRIARLTIDAYRTVLADTT